MAKKFYVLDTNTLMESPDAIFGFDDNIVAIPATVLQELDKHKRDIGEPGYNARESIRILESVVTEGNRHTVKNRDFVESLSGMVTPADIVGKSKLYSKSVNEAMENAGREKETMPSLEELMSYDGDKLEKVMAGFPEPSYEWDRIFPRIISHLQAYRRWEDNEFCSGYSLKNGGALTLIKCDGKSSGITPEYKFSNPDNLILQSVLDLMTAYDHYAYEWLESVGVTIPVVLVSNDVSLRLNARALGIRAQSYKNVRIEAEDIYTGRTERNCDDGTWAKYFDELKKNGSAAVRPEDEEGLHEHEYIVMNRANENTGLVAVYKQETLLLVDPARYHPMGVSPRNAAQIMALDALMAPVEEIPLVILEGPAGTAKTFLSTASGIDQTIRLGKKREGTYSKVIITRNNVLADADHGALPGDLDDKLFPLMAPFYDNLESIFSIESGNEDPAEIRMQIDDLFENGVIEAFSMAYIRGRSLSNTFLILDECQNATRGQILTCLTRAAEKCKIVIAGCIDQIDNARLDKYNNGLSFAIERFRDSPLAAQVTFTDEECVRSPLAAEASRLLSEDPR